MNRFADTAAKLDWLRAEFTERVQDPFGRAVLEEILLPLVSEMVSLMEAEESWQQFTREHDERLAQIRAMNP